MSASYRDDLRELSDRLISIQKPIQILNAIKWPAGASEEFIRCGGRELPRVNRASYLETPLGFDPDSVLRELKTLDADIQRRLGEDDALGKILRETLEQFQLVVDLLGARGTPEFARLSRELYGSATDHLRGDSNTLMELGERFCEIFSLPAATHLSHPYPKTIPAAEAVDILRERLGEHFPGGEANVILSDGIVSDAAAGGDKVKLNSNARFSELDLRVYEVHEGWVHVGTTLNGRAQPYASWLSIGSPRIAAMQEGLAVLMECLTMSSYPDRARRVSDRVMAIHMAEEGADFIEIYRYFVAKGLTEHDACKVSQRVFRGGMVEGGSYFTKDISYIRGLVENINFIKSCIAFGLPELLPMMFVGKATLDDIPTLYERSLDGLIAPAKFLPPMFRDLNGLYVWFGFASGMGLVDIDLVQAHYQALFSHIPPRQPLQEAPLDCEFD